jgi:hypothetical protein
MSSYSQYRRERLDALERRWQGRRPRTTRVATGRTFIEQWLVCCAWGAPAEWERLARQPPRDEVDVSGRRLAFELGRLRALGRAFGLGEAWESIERGDFLELVSPMGSVRDPARATPFLEWCTAWAWRLLPDAGAWHSYLESRVPSPKLRSEKAQLPGPDAIRRLLGERVTDRGLVHSWRDLLGQCVRVHLARPRDLVYEGPGFYRASAVCLSRVDRVLARAAEPCLAFLAWCVDPWAVGIPFAELVEEWGYRAGLEVDQELGE